MMGILSFISGVICIVIGLRIYIPDIKKADTAKEKWMEFFDFVTNPFSLFYIGLLLMIYGLVSVSNSL